MTNVSLQSIKSLITLSADGDNFYAVISTLQSLYTYLQHNSSSKCEDNYGKLMAYLIENYLDESKQLFLRQHLAEMIARQTKDEQAAGYFKQRFTKAELLDLLKHYHNLTGKRLVVTSVDYDRQKFKLKQV